MIKHFIAFLLLLMTSLESNSQPGTIDTTFGNPVLNIGDSSRFDGNVNHILQQPDGKILIAGSMNKYNDVSCASIVRFLEDGTPDTSFNALPFGISSGLYGIKQMALQPDGKIIIGGSFDNAPGNHVNAVARLNSDGSFDSTFFMGNGFNHQPWLVALQSDGKIIVAGGFELFNGDSAKYLVRLNSNGTLDTTFHTGTSFDYAVSTVAIQADGKIIAGGNFYSYQGIPSPFIIRLNPDGSKDTTFYHGYWDSFVRAIEIQPDQKILVGGGFANPAYRFVRLNTNGSRDTTFHVHYDGVDQSVFAIEVQPDGKIFFGGPFTRFDSIPINGLARVNPDGSRDSTFFIGNGVLSPTTICVLTDGKVMLGGGFGSVNGTMRNNIARLHPSGYLEDIFRVEYGFEYAVKKIMFLPNGQLLAGGNFHRYNGSVYHNLLRLNSTDGSIDTSFHTNIRDINSVFDIDFDYTLNKTYVVGNLDVNYNSIHCYGIARINDDGEPDSTFYVGNAFNSSSYLNAVAVQADGKIVAGGVFGSYNGTTINGLIRILPDGNRDTTFTTLPFFQSNEVFDVLIQPDGKLIVCGDFIYSLSPSVNSRYIVRLLPDGLIDSTFNPGKGFSLYVHTLALQPDGKILAGGLFKEFNDIDTCYRIARLNSDGSFDPTFASGTKLEGQVRTILLQPDGKIIVGGSITEYDNQPRSNIVRLNADAKEDLSFVTGTGFNYPVNTLQLDPSGRLLVGGEFKNYNGYAINDLCRLDPGIITTVKELIASKDFRVYPNPTSGSINFGNETDFHFPLRITITNLIGEILEVKTIHSFQETISISQTNGLYVLTINDGINILSKRILIQN